MTIARSLRFVVAPLLIMALGLAFFELSGLDTSRLCEIAVGDVSDARSLSDRMLYESATRIVWLGTAVAYVVAASVTAIVSVIVMRASLRAASVRPFAMLAVVAVVAVGGGAIVGPMVSGEAAGGSGACAHGDGSVLVHVTQSLPVGLLRDFYRSNGLEAPPLLGLGASLNVIGALAVTLAILAATAALTGVEDPPTPRCAARIAGQMRRIRWVVEILSIQFVVGILQILAWLRLPATVAPGATEARGIADLAWSVALYWGAVFTLAIAAYYAPVAIYLTRLAGDAMRTAPDDDRPADVPRWLRDHALSGALGVQLPQVAIILAPMFAAPIGSALTSWMSPLGG